MRAATPFCGACRIGFEGDMKELEKSLRDALGEFYASPLCMVKLAAIAAQISQDDQDYVPDYLLELISLRDGHVMLTRRMCEFFAVDKTAPNTGDENTLFFQALPDTAAFVLSNKDIAPIMFEKTTSIFQDLFLSLCELAKEDHSLAKATMFFGVAMTLYEWLDRQRSIPYDPDIHGPITFASGPPKKLK
jgi:hypothetical protein